MQKPKEKKLPKHHYIPVFYLKQWTGGDGCLCEFSNKYKEVKPRRTSPDGTGYVRGLYTLPNLPPENADIVEAKYMKTIDNDAAVALRVLLDDGPKALTQKLKIQWARFVHCLILRNPEYLAAITSILQSDIPGTVEAHRPDYERIKSEHDPPTFDEFKAKFLANPLNTAGARIINQLVDSEFMVGHMCTMSWNIFHIERSSHLLLTSDRPVIMTNGIGRPEGHLALPISPKDLFVAFNDKAGYKGVRGMSARSIITNSNTKVVEQAQHFVFGFSDASLSFVSSRLGKRIPTTPLETGIFRLANSGSKRSPDGTKLNPG